VNLTARWMLSNQKKSVPRSRWRLHRGLVLLSFQPLRVLIFSIFLVSSFLSQTWCYDGPKNICLCQAFRQFIAWLCVFFLFVFCFVFFEVAFRTLPHLKCISLGSVRSSYLPFTMHWVGLFTLKSPYICYRAWIATTFCLFLGNFVLD